MSKNQRMNLTANATINVIQEWIMFVGGHKKQVFKRLIITNAILIGKHVNETKQLERCTKDLAISQEILSEIVSSFRKLISTILGKALAKVRQNFLIFSVGIENDMK